MNENPVIIVKNISKRYYIEKRKKHHGAFNIFSIFRNPLQYINERRMAGKEKSIWALRNISFEVDRGDRVGIIGRNGAGKTTLLKILSRLIYPTEGEAVLKGRSTALFGVGTGFKPKLTGRENIFYGATLYGLSKKEINSKYDEIVEFSGLQRFIDTPVQYYSKGMYTRLAFSVAAHLDPEILFLDEVLAGGDISFQKKCLQRIDGHAKSGRTILFVSHNMNAVISLCNRCIWLEEGRIVETGAPKDVVGAYSKRMLNLQSTYFSEPLSNPTPKPQRDFENEREVTGAALVSFKISDLNGIHKELFFRDEPIKVEVVYQILRDDIDIIPVVHLHRDGDHAFSTHPANIYKAPLHSTCRAESIIPGKYLNTGEYNFSVAIVTPARPKWRHVYLENVLSIKVVRSNSGDRIFSGDYRGCVRPSIDWESSHLDR